MSNRPIRFFHRGAVVEVADVATTRTVLDWLREDARCTGTKEGCNEGDCGACTVVVGEWVGTEAGSDGGNAADGANGDPTRVAPQLRLTTTNACIAFLPSLDGKALFTVEDLAADGGRLHPVQQAMVDCHASQCGFCTPGFVMSLWATYQHHAARGTRPTRQALADELSGNLCRCTGYRPILDAGERMFELVPAPIEAAPVVAALESLRDAGETFRYADPAGATHVAPRTLAAFAAEREAHPDARILAGCTDIGLWTNKQFRDLPALIAIGGVDELRRIEVRNGVLSIGVAASLESAWRALVARHPMLADVWLRFAGTPLRHSGTMGGNVANGSPIGDSAPVLMALDASLVLRRGARERRLRLADFYTGYMLSRLEPGEFVQAIEVPITLPPAGLRVDVRAYKLSKRFDCDISAVCAGLAIERDDGGIVGAARFAFGGMAATVRRADATERAVAGQPWNEATVAAARAALATDFQPMSDMRASAAYRMRAAQNLLTRLWLETRDGSPLPSAATSVWGEMAHVIPVEPLREMQS